MRLQAAKNGAAVPSEDLTSCNNFVYAKRGLPINQIPPLPPGGAGAGLIGLACMSLRHGSVKASPREAILGSRSHVLHTTLWTRHEYALKILDCAAETSTYRQIVLDSHVVLRIFGPPYQPESFKILTSS